MRNLLRRVLIISLGLLTLLLVQPTAVTTALADDCCWECCDCCECCCDDDEEPKCSTVHKSMAEPWGCDMNVRDCPEGSQPINVLCSYVSPALAMPMDPPLHSHDQVQLTALVNDAMANGQLVYVRYMVCEGFHRVASYHLVNDNGAEIHPAELAFLECGTPDQGDPMWGLPIDPLCGEPPYRYVNP